MLEFLGKDRKVTSQSNQKLNSSESPLDIGTFCLFKCHCVKSIHIRSCFGPYFPAFGLKTERYGVTMELIIQKNPVLTVVIGDFNAKSSKWQTDAKTSQEGLKIENLLSQFFLSQVINEPTHIFQNFNSCIDLLFTNQQNLINDLGIHPSLHSNCRHQIICGKFNLKYFFPPRMKDIFGIINMQMLI